MSTSVQPHLMASIQYQKDLAMYYLEAKQISAPMKVVNAIALSKSRFVLNLKYADKASVAIKTASVIPPMCKKM